MNYHRIYSQLVGQHRVIDGYSERHHILPRCLGGSDDFSNLVALTPEEHFVAHVLLVKMYPESRDLICAVQKMTQGKRRTRRMVGWLRRRFAARMHELNSGSGNSQFGSRWIHRGLENKKISKTDMIPEGWEAGRKMKVRTCPHCGVEFTSRYVCVDCSKNQPWAKSRQKITDAQIISAIKLSTTKKLVDIAKILKCKNPNNMGTLRRRIIRYKSELMNAPIS